MASKPPGYRRLLDPKRSFREMPVPTGPVYKKQLNFSPGELETWRGSKRFAADAFLARWFPV